MASDKGRAIFHVNIKYIIARNQLLCRLRKQNKNNF